MRAILMVLGAAVFGCAGGARSTFDFTTSGDLVERVASAPTVKGEINDAGHLALDDGTWLLTMSLDGLGVTQDQPVIELTLVDRDIGERFSTSVGGSCGYQLEPHQSSNGDVVQGTFHCAGLASDDGKSIDIAFGEFSTAIDDAANDPNLNPPPVPPGP